MSNQIEPPKKPSAPAKPLSPSEVKHEILYLGDSATIEVGSIKINGRVIQNCVVGLSWDGGYDSGNIVLGYDQNIEDTPKYKERLAKYEQSLVDYEGKLKTHERAMKAYKIELAAYWKAAAKAELKELSKQFNKDELAEILK